MDKIVESLREKQAKLAPRIKLADARCELLAVAARDYEDATQETQTPEECAHLDRMILLVRVAERILEDLKDRVALLGKAIDALQEAQEIVTGRQERLGRDRWLRSPATRAGIPRRALNITT